MKADQMGVREVAQTVMWKARRTVVLMAMLIVAQTWLLRITFVLEK